MPVFPRIPSHRIALAIFIFTVFATIAALIGGADTLVVVLIAVIGVWIVGAVLWIGSPKTEKTWAELGSGLMIGMGVGFLVWFAQFHLGNKLEEDSKRRAFRLSVSTQQNLLGIDLKGEQLVGFHLAGKNLSGAQLQGANLTGAVLEEADLTGADLSGANLTEANLHDATLVDAVFNGATLNGADLTSAKAQGASFHHAELRDSEMAGVKLADACLAKADLRGAEAEGAEMERAVFTNADVRGTRFEFDLRGAALDDAGLSTIKHDSTTTWPSNFELNKVRSFRPPVVPAVPEEVFSSDKIEQVVDGDTLKFVDLGPVRLIGINTADIDTAAGHAAAEHVRANFPPGSAVKFVHGKEAQDKFGRHLIYAWDVDGGFINANILAAGVAERMENPTNNRYEAALRDAETHAKRGGKGIWRVCPRD